MRPSLSPAELEKDRARRAEYRRQQAANHLENLVMEMRRNSENP
jgi:hypothetical protein